MIYLWGKEVRSVAREIATEYGEIDGTSFSVDIYDISEKDMRKLLAALFEEDKDLVYEALAQSNISVADYSIRFLKGNSIECGSDLLKIMYKCFFDYAKDSIQELLNEELANELAYSAPKYSEWGKYL